MTYLPIAKHIFKRRNIQRTRIKIKLKYKIEKNSSNFEQKKTGRKVQRKLAGWHKRNNIWITGVLAKAEKWKRKSSKRKLIPKSISQRSNLLKGNRGVAKFKLSKSDALGWEFEHGPSKLILPATQTARDEGGIPVHFWHPWWRQNLTLTHMTTESLNIPMFRYWEGKGK